MTQAQLLYEFSQLPLQQQLEVVQAAVQLIAQQVEAVAQPVNGRNESSRLAIAANALLADYLEDQELTSFTALDGKPLYAEGVRYGCSTWDPTIGAEIRKVRPAVIVKDNGVGVLPLRVIVPLTDWRDRYTLAPWMVRIAPTPSNGLSKVSAADTFQVRSLSQERFLQQIGVLTNVQMGAIAKALATVLAIK